MEKIVKSEKGVQHGMNLIKGVGISLFLTLVCLLIFALLLTYTDINEIYIEPVIMLITGLSILIRKFYRKYKNKKKWNVKWWIGWNNIFTNFIFYF